MDPNSQSPYGSYGYPPVPPPPSNHPYPPPPAGQYPPPPSVLYPYPQYPHYPSPSYHNAYAAPNYPYLSTQSAPQSPGAHHQGPLEQGYQTPSHDGSNHYPYQGYATPAQPTLQQHNSFHYGSSHHFQHSGSFQRPEPLHRQDSSASVSGSSTNYGRVSDDAHSYSSAYPPIDDHLANLHLSNNQSSSPAASLAPSPPPNYHSGPSPMNMNYNGGAVYGYSNVPFSSWETSSPAPSQSPPHPSGIRPPMYVHIPHNSADFQLVPVASPKGSLKVLLLHGNLDIWIYEAKNLPNMDMFHKTLGDMFNKLPGNVSTKIEGHMNHKITSDPYVSITVAGATVGRTYVISNDENPVWMQHFNVPVAHYAAEVHFVVKDNDVVGSQLIGNVSIPVDQIYEGGKIEGFFPILGTNGKPCKVGAVLSISIQYIPMQKLSSYRYGVGAGPDYAGVPGTYFPLRRGGRVTLYQDAHVPDGSLPNLKLDYGREYVHGKCWYEMFDAIRQARRLVYITGWSVWHKVRLVRDEKYRAAYTLGELLKAKSQEGVRVLLLIWDDPTSRSILGYKTVSNLVGYCREKNNDFLFFIIEVP